MMRLAFVLVGAVLMVALFTHGLDWLQAVLPADWSGEARFGATMLAAVGLLALIPLADGLRPAAAKARIRK